MSEPPRASGASRDARPAAAPVSIRAVAPLDIDRVWDLMRELAVFERLESAMTGSRERLAANLFGDAWPRLDGLVAERGGELVGYALFFGAYSSFRTQPLLWLEDLYVTPSARGEGLGRALLARVARVAVERGCAQLDWAVLEWNEAAIGFYERLGAARGAGWHTYRLTDEALRSLAGSSPPAE